MKPHRLYSRLHNPNFRFRETEIERIEYCWSQGQSVLLTGIRRTGKSEVLKAALCRLAKMGKAVGYLDVQCQNSLPRFYQYLLEILLRESPPRRLSENTPLALSPKKILTTLMAASPNLFQLDGMTHL